MAIVNSALSSFLLCLAIENSIILADGTSGRNETILTNAGTSKETLRVPDVWEPSNIPITSRILDGTTHPKRLKKPPSDAVNLTSFVTIRSDFDYSTTPKLPDTTSVLSPPSSKIVDFKPSVHIGEINDHDLRKTSLSGGNPFEKSTHATFENTVRIDESIDTDGASVPTSSSREQIVAGSIVGTNKIPMKFFETDSRYRVNVPIDAEREQHHYSEPNRLRSQFPVQYIENEEEDNDSHKSHDHYHDDNVEVAIGQGALMTFEDPRSPEYISSEPSTAARPFYPSGMTEPQFFNYQYQNYVIPPGHHTVYSKPTKLHVNTFASSPNTVRFQHYEYPPIASGEVADKPEVQSFHHQSGHYPGEYYHQSGNYHHGDNYQQLSPHETSLNQIVKPDTLLYVTSHRESAFTRMQHFPYKFYEPSSSGHRDEYHFPLQEVPHAFPLKERRVSPWKKIIHLIGAFLPLGLLLATLKPNVLRIENTTQPNIVLSKLRVIDLPVEHKLGRLVDKQRDEFQEDTCDDRSICELIVSGSEPNSNLLHNILWNLTNRSTDEEVHKHGLEEIFTAAKRKDCSSIDC